MRLCPRGDLSTPEVLPIVGNGSRVGMGHLRGDVRASPRCGTGTPRVDAGEVDEAGHAVAGRFGDRWRLSRRDVRGYGFEATQLCRRTGVP